MQNATLLLAEEVQRVHEASLEILQNVGIMVRNPRARAVFARHGCAVDQQTQVVKIAPRLVEEQRKTFPSSFSFRGREPRFDRSIPRDRPVVVTGSSAPNLIDPESGEERSSTSLDIANIAFLINELPGYDVFSISTLASDASPEQFSLARFYSALKNCLKPVRGNTLNMKELTEVLELGWLIAGSKEAYRERPLITHHYCPVISPLTMDVESTEALLFLTENELPVFATIVPNAGMSSPMTLAGTLALGNAEFLALGTLQQMVRPCSPLIYSVLSTVADMRTASYAPGAIETSILQMAHCQLARYYGVPSGGYIGLTNSHSNDAQSGYESGMGTTAALLGGADMLNMGGLLGALMDFDFAKAVIDNEIALMLKRLWRGLEFCEENLAMAQIAESGPGGSYMASRHTVDHMRSASFASRLAFREGRGSWIQQGKPGMAERALTAAREILSGSNPAFFSPELEARIRNRFSGLVAGTCGWKY